MARDSDGIKMAAEWRFVSERKQISLIADEKSPARISHRFFATSRSEKRIREWLDIFITDANWNC